MHVQAMTEGVAPVSNDEQCMCSAQFFECLTQCVDLDTMSLMWQGVCANLTRVFHEFGTAEAARQVIALCAILNAKLCSFSRSQ